MSDASRQPPHRFHLLRLPHLLLQAASRRDISRGHHNSSHRNIIEQIVSHGFQPDPGVIFTAEAKLRRRRASHLQRDPFQRTPYCKAIIGMNEREKVLAQQFRRLVSGDAFDGRAVVKHGPVHRHYRNHVRKILHEVPEALLAPSQNRLGFDPLADVAKDTHDRPPSLELRNTRVHLNRKARSIGTL